MLLSGLLIFFFYTNNSEIENSNHVNNLRLDSNQVYETICEFWPLIDENIDTIIEKAKLSDIYLTIVTLDEIVLYSNSLTIEMSGENILLDALYMDSSYAVKNKDSFKISQPIYHNNKVAAFVIFEKVYDSTVVKNMVSKQIITGMIFFIIFVLILIAGFLLFNKSKKDLRIIEKGIKDISKGVLIPISDIKDNEYKQIYIAFNILVDELTYIMKQQQSYEGQRKSFLTMISHELKTPIATINAYVEGLVSGVANDEETKERYLAVISDKIQQLTKQVEDFFNYAQDEANRFKYNFEECYADEVIGKMFSSLVNNIRPSTKVENLLPKCIFNIDKIRLEQVIMNLYNNSIKHTTKDDSIILRTYREDNEVVIEIEDKGEGISPKDLPYIFDYYYQGQTSKKSDYEGIGLGLAICKNIINSHKGKIKVKSKVGKGTTMIIKIPLV